VSCDRDAASGYQVRDGEDVPVVYDGVITSLGYRVDFIVEAKVIVEVKAVENVLPIHIAQLISYQNLSRTRVGLLLNFNVERFEDAIHRKVWGYE